MLTACQLQTLPSSVVLWRQSAYSLGKILPNILREALPSLNCACHIRRALAYDAVRIGAIARAAYTKYIARIGRAPSPMVVDFAAEIAADHVAVIETGGVIAGYMIAWPETDAYFIDSIAIDPARQGEGLGRRLIDHAVGEARRFRLPAIQLYTNVAMTENLSMYAHLGFVETHRAIEKGFHRVYLCLNVPEDRQYEFRSGSEP
jgi:ribosomal protein S18 acetylase RimI-like enzyme